MYKYTDELQSGKNPMSTNVLARLQEDILTGRLVPGFKLTEQNICDTYGVSRTPVREALRQLETDGLIEYILNRGSFVTGMSGSDFRDMLQMRKILEVQAVTWAIRRITEEEMERLDETFEFMEFYSMREDLDKMLVINTGFHNIIHEACHNRVLVRQLESFMSVLRYRGTDAVHEENYLRTALEEHRQIFRAFVEKNPENGAQAMEFHMQMSMQRRMNASF